MRCAVGRERDGGMGKPGWEFPSPRIGRDLPGWLRGASIFLIPSLPVTKERAVFIPCLETKPLRGRRERRNIYEPAKKNRTGPKASRHRDGRQWLAGGRRGVGGHFGHGRILRLGGLVDQTATPGGATPGRSSPSQPGY